MIEIDDARRIAETKASKYGCVVKKQWTNGGRFAFSIGTKERVDVSRPIITVGKDGSVDVLEPLSDEWFSSMDGL